MDDPWAAVWPKPWTISYYYLADVKLQDFLRKSLLNIRFTPDRMGAGNKPIPDPLHTNLATEEGMPRKSNGYVYFIQGGPGGLIKIGWTEGHPDRRLYTLRTMSPVELIPLGVKPSWLRWAESHLHCRFGHLRRHGEWFRPGEDLLDYIARRAKPWPKDDELSCEPTREMTRRDHEKELEDIIEWALEIERIRRHANSGIEYYI